MTPQEWSNGFSAAWGLVQGRDAALGKLDQSVDGFFRSFAPLGLALVIDAVALAIIGQAAQEARQFSLATFIILRLAFALVAYGISFVALYFLLAPEKRGRITSAIAGHNWVAPIASIIGLPLALASTRTGDGPQAFETLLFVATLVLLVMIGIRVMRICLHTTAGHAALLFVATGLTSMLVHELLNRMAGF